MYKLLIVDDEKIIRESICELIDWESLDVQITACCKNGLEALDAIMDTAPDIVMTDISMPGIDGLELVEKIRKLDSHIQFVILTGYPEFEYARRAITYGVREYLLKPIHEDAIMEAVQHVKTFFPTYSNLAVSQCITDLLEIRPSEDWLKAENVLGCFFSHFRLANELRTPALYMMIELHTRYEPLSADTFALFTQRILIEPDYFALCELIKQQISALLFAPEQSKNSLSDSVKQHIHQYLNDENLSLKYIAENILYINVNYLSRTFTKQTGENFSNYLNRTRIETAKKLLAASDNVNIHMVAESVGFGSNPQYFSQVFKKYTKITPTQFAEASRT